MYRQNLIGNLLVEFVTCPACALSAFQSELMDHIESELYTVKNTEITVNCNKIISKILCSLISDWIATLLLSNLDSSSSSSYYYYYYFYYYYFNARFLSANLSCSYQDFDAVPNPEGSV